MIVGTCIIIVDASNTIGFGHLSRCLLIGEFLKSKGLSIQFLSTQDDPEDIIKKQGFIWTKISTLEVNLSIFFGKGKSPRIVISDINNNETFNLYEDYTNFLDVLKIQTDILLSFEDLIDFPYPSDIVVIPYVGSKNLKLLHNKKGKYLLGASFFPIASNFNKKKLFSKKINTVLVTMGGSDPEKITLKVLSAFNKTKIKCEINIVIGKMSKITNQEIKNFSSNIKENLIVSRNVENLSKLMHRSDLAITNSGLTRYELAYVGVPMLIISNNQTQADYSEIFVSETTGMHLGYNNVVSEEDILSGYNSIASNNNKRLNMIKKGQELVDGDGLKRIYNSLSIL